MEIYRSKIDYFGYLILIIIFVLLSFLPFIYIGNSNKIVLVFTIFIDVLLVGLFARHEIRVIKFFDVGFEAYYPIMGLKKHYKYEDVSEVIYSPPRAKAGRALIIKIVSNNVKEKIIFGYYSNNNNLLEFLQMKGIKVVYESSKNW